jgi:hypothetical protein
MSHTAEQHEAEMIRLTRAHFAADVAALAADGLSLDTETETALYWEMAEEQAANELARRERANRAEAADEILDRALAVMCA